ncbi:MAG: 50S ribosomal protein L9 [Lachnospiraceae bacterium]|nr:50S ribosomal protein L9 [Lachnospiraceae bacterium]
MKIILTEDVKKLGKRGEIVEVSDGYAKNYVIPQKLGVAANEKNMNEWKNQKRREDKLAQVRLEEAQALAGQIGAVTVEIGMKGGTSGKVFGAVSTKEIATALKKQHDLEIDKKKIVMDEPIKAFGTVELPVKLHPEVTAKLKVRVVQVDQP